MTVTKQQQLEWLVKECDEWPVNGEYFTMNRYAVGVCVHAHVITREEWKQERDKMSSKPEVDNSWHERGELPPVGSIVTVANDYETHDISDYSRDCIDVECVVMAVFERDNGVNRSKIVCVMEPEGGCYCFLLSMIRPIRTEREKAIDEMVYEMLDSHGDHKVGQRHLEIASKLYDAGYRKVKP